MAYQSGDTILDDHYNIFVQGGASAVDHNTANVNTLWGSGTSDKGYNQTGTLSTVSAGSTITATQWVNLLNRISTIANHQGSTITSITNPSTGDTISAYTALSGNLTTITTNRGNAAAVGTTYNTSGSRATTGTWDVSAVCTLTVTFSSNAAFRAFFNAGGRVGLNYSRSGGTSSTKNTSWTNLLTACGTLYTTGGTLTQNIAGTNYQGTLKSGGSGTTNILATTTGAFDFTTSNVNIFRQYDSTYLYTSNYVTVAAKVNSATPTAITYTVTLTDAAADEVDPIGRSAITNLDIVDGTLTANIFYSNPSTTYLSSAGWGTPTLSTTAWSLSS